MKLYNRLMDNMADQKMTVHGVEWSGWSNVG